jgi:hypothetical protein
MWHELFLPVIFNVFFAGARWFNIYFKGGAYERTSFYQKGFLEISGHVYGNERIRRGSR